MYVCGLLLLSAEGKHLSVFVLRRKENEKKWVSVWINLLFNTAFSDFQTVFKCKKDNF